MKNKRGFRERVYECVATFFYAGFLPKAPGTWGSLAALPFIVFLRDQSLYASTLLVLFLAGRVAADRYARQRGESDPGCIVIDEVVGMFITLWFVPFSWITLIAGFLFFRLFDITKPFFIKRVERYAHGWGIMFDDMIAGVYANLVLQVIIFCFR